MRALLRRAAALFRHEAMDRELDEELRFHLEMKVRDMAGDRFAARRALGNALLLRERGRDAWGWRFLDELAQDVRYALRGLRRSKGFAAAAILTLALAIGANCLVFSVADATLFRPFAFRDPGRLVYLWSTTPKYPQMYSATGDYLEWRAQNTVFEDVGAYGTSGYLDLSEGAYSERIGGTAASASFFQVAGIEAELGRTFLPEEELSARSHVVLLSDHLWRRRFGANPNVIGTAISGATYDNPHAVYTVVGVLPPEIEQTDRFQDYWTPLVRDDAFARTFAGGGMSVVGRLKPGVSVAAAQASMRALVERLRPLHKRSYQDMSVSVTSYQDELTRQFRPETLLLLGAVTLVLLIACVNVANLMLARGAERAHEFSIRSAVGAGRRRLFRQLLTESLALGVIGGIFGVAIAYGSVRAVRAALPAYTLRRETIGVNGKVLLATLIISVASGVLLGLLPAFKASKVNVKARERTVWRGALVVSEIALALILVSGAGLMVNSLVRLITRDLGFNRRDLFVVHSDLPWNRYPTPATRVPIERTILERMRALPGVRGAAIADTNPLAGGNTLHVRKAPEEDSVQVASQSVTPEYFEVMGIPMRRGRGFTERDDWTSQKVVIVDQSAADRFWPNENPVGKMIWVQRGGWIRSQIIGVVGNAVGMRLNQAPQPFLYLPQAQDSNLSTLSIVLRVANPTPLIPTIRKELAAIDSTLVVQSSINMQVLVDAQLAEPRFLTLVLAVFALLALGLTITGIAGVIGYLVRARTYEFGVRMALGARPGQVLALVCGYGAALTAGGVAIGIGGSLALTRLLTAYLYEVAPADAATLAAVAGVVLAAAMLACYGPARRTTTIDPSQALRHD